MGTKDEIRPKIMARFDVQKSKWGSISGTKKYFEHGLATWTGMGGIPILYKDAVKVAEFETKWNSYSTSQKNIVLDYFKRVYQESRGELIKDFGREFVFGK